MRVVGDGDDRDHAVRRPDRPHADASAFCAAEWPQLVRALSLYVGDPYVAEELAQEALLRACRQWATVSQLDSPGGWTWRVATNLANSHFRRARAARRPSNASALMTAPTVTLTAAMPLRSASPSPPCQNGNAPLWCSATCSICPPPRSPTAWDSTPDAVRSLTKPATATLRDQLGEHTTLASREVHDA